MALINCYECGRSISSEAPLCPWCGAPRRDLLKSSGNQGRTITFCNAAFTREIPEEWLYESGDKQRLYNTFFKSTSIDFNSALYGKEFIAAKLSGDSHNLEQIGRAYASATMRKNVGSYSDGGYKETKYSFETNGVLTITTVQYSPYSRPAMGIPTTQTNQYIVYKDYILTDNHQYYKVIDGSLYLIAYFEKSFFDEINSISSTLKKKADEKRQMIQTEIRNKLRCPKCTSTNIGTKGILIKRKCCLNCGTYLD